MKRIISSLIVLVCTIFVSSCQQSAGRQMQNPYIKALKLHGDISSLKIYYQMWDTEFGERVDGNKTLKSTLYYDKNHRLLYVTDNRYHYFYEYEYSDGMLSTINCYEHRIDVPTSYGLEFKIKFVKENVIIVAHIYNSRGNEEDIYSPYNVYPGTGCGVVYPYPESSVRYAGNYFYLFAFEIMPKTYELDKKDVCEFNSDGQITFYKSWLMTDEQGNDYYDTGYSYEYNSDGKLSAIGLIDLDYDSIGNIISIDTDQGGTGHGYTYTFEYEYGNFEESEKFRRENFLNEIARQEAVRDSIARAEKLAAEQAIRDREAARKLAEKQKWEQRLPVIKEFAAALTNPSNRSRYSVNVSQYDGIAILYHDYGRAQISTKEFYKYSDGAGNNYNVYCNDELTSMIFSSGKGKEYLVRKWGDSFQVYDISAYVDL